MLQIDFDLSQLTERAKTLGAASDQIPYAIARSLNDAAEVTRSFLIGTTWPSSIKQRNTSFIKAALTTKGARANKRDLSVEIYDRLHRANLALHSTGGTRSARGANIAIPSINVTRTGRGVRKDQKPRVLARSFRKGKSIMQATGKGKNKKVRLMYTLKPNVSMRRDVPFQTDFGRIMQAELAKALPVNIARAMATRR